MESDTQPAPTSKTMLWAGHIMSVLPVLLLLFSGTMKLVKSAVVVEGFTHLGYPPIVLGVLVWGGLHLRDGRLRALLPWRT